MKLTFTIGQFVLEKTDGSKENVDLNVAARSRAYADEVATRVLCRALSRQYELPPMPLLQDADPHQVDGIYWMLTRSRSYLAHAPGAGKTYQAIKAAELALGTGQILFIVPPNMTSHWESQIWQWSDKSWPKIAIVPESSHQLKMNWEAEYIICPDSMLTKAWVLPKLLSMQKKFIAVDEADRFKEITSNRTLALFGGKLPRKKYPTPGIIQDARHSVLMSGSPMPNRPMELWAPVTAMDPLAIDCMSRTEFGHKYCGPRPNEFGRIEFRGSCNEEELKQKLQKSFMHVVTEDKLSHPERRRSMLFMNKDVRNAEMKDWQEKNILTFKVKLDAPNESLSKGELATHRRELGLRKVAWGASYIKDRLRYMNESIIVYTWHREVGIELARLLANSNPGLVIGGTDSETRDLYFRQFRENQRRLLIGNISALGIGHNLQRADRIIFLEFSWSNEYNVQAEKRASRKGRDKENFVRSDYIVVPYSIDEIVLKNIFRTEKAVKRIIG